jgi:tRNA 2-thiouridine synthesizing protein A
MTSIREDKTVDARGLDCPLPLLRVKKAMVDMDPGQILKVIVTDPGATRNFEAFARHTKNILLNQPAEPLAEQPTGHAHILKHTKYAKHAKHTVEAVFFIRKS